jgi:sec-independent protein translocase protein TatB
VFNIQGSEMIFLLLIALIVLGPEKLPDAIRKFGRAYSEFKKMANGFQGELRDALDEPMRELKDTADAMRAAANFDLDGILGSGSSTNTTPAPETPVVDTNQREQGLNFGSANPRKIATGPFPAGDATPTGETAAPDEPARTAGLNFGSANPRRERTARDPLAPVEPPAVAADNPEPADVPGESES